MDKRRHKKRLLLCFFLGLLLVLLVSFCIPSSTNVGIIEEIERPDVEDPPGDPPIPWISKGAALAKKPILLVGNEGEWSSVMGSVFEQDPRIVYYSEPTDAGYSRLYGTTSQWSGLDLRYYVNGTPRPTAELEILFLEENIRRYFECSVHLLPESLGNMMLLNRETTSAFSECVWSHKQDRDCEANSKLASYKMRCYPYFTGQREKSPGTSELDKTPDQKCLEELQILEEKSWKIMYKDGREGLENVYAEMERELMAQASGVVGRAFTQYHLCHYQFTYQHLRPCLHHLENKCSSSSTVMAMDTRLPVSLLSRFLYSVPNLKVVYVVDSPLEMLKYRVHYKRESHLALSDIVKEATYLCKTIREDLDLIKVLDKKHPLQISLITFEDFVHEPLRVIENMYDFFNSTMPTEIKKYLEQHSSLIGRTDFPGLSAKQVAEIEDACRDTSI